MAAVLVLVGILALNFNQSEVQDYQEKNSSEQVSAECDQEYNGVLNEEMAVENISEGCRPIPDDVSNQILAMELQG